MHGRTLTLGRTRRSLSLIIQDLGKSGKTGPATPEHGAEASRDALAAIDTTRERVLTQDEITMLLNAKSMEATQTA